jgi:tRNA 5-methylaminomethyl-2-thiouridine biosynthesis bifunctional protein
MQLPFSEQFRDIYFSAEDGLAETRHTFLAGNALPAAWSNRARFTIAETGFGTGLNFLAAWSLFEQTAPPDATLDYCAVELYPLTAPEIGAALARWQNEFGPRLNRLLAQWPMRIPGFHRLHFGRVRLTLIFDDVAEALPQLNVPQGVDAWFLDGFAPAKNPGMWSDTLYKEMARLSASGASAATFTAAGMVRRGLAEAGFSVEKVNGYGRKRDMTIARFPGSRVAPARPSGCVAIVGGGLAGTSIAAALSRRNRPSVLYEAADHIAPAASGNPLGLCNPRFSALRSGQSDFYGAAYALAYHTFVSLPDIGFNPCGSLHLINTPEKAKRFESLLGHWRWDSAHMQLLAAADASALAGVPLTVPALSLPQSMQVSPAMLCRTLAAGSDIRLGEPAMISQDDGGWIVNGVPYDTVILATGAGSGDHPLLAGLPVHTVRGQITNVAATPASAPLKTNLCYGGYLSALVDGVHMAGSSFQKWLSHTEPLPADDADNLAKLAAAVPALAGDYKILGSRAGLRLASRDHFPLAGRLRDGLYVSLAHGSHGILSSLASAEYLADLMEGTPASLSMGTQRALSPLRFSDKF